MKIETKRLILRPWKKKDKKDLIENINNKNVVKYMSCSVPYPYKQKDASTWINRCENKEKKKIKDEYPFAIELKLEKRIIGGIALHEIDSSSKRAEIGYWVGEKYWRKGIVSEAAEALLNFSFNKLKLNRVYAFVATQNIASNRLAKKLGFKYEGMLRKHSMSSLGKINDLYVYGLLKKDFKK
jgi:RimJ/RimL family protein N-acetyltransferase